MYVHSRHVLFRVPVPVPSNSRSCQCWNICAGQKLSFFLLVEINDAASESAKDELVCAVAPSTEIFAGQAVLFFLAFPVACMSASFTAERSNV